MGFFNHRFPALENIYTKEKVEIFYCNLNPLMFVYYESEKFVAYFLHLNIQTL